MPVETAADLAAFFDEAEFAVEAAFTPAGGSSSTVSVILDEGDSRADPGGAGYVGARRVARVRKSEVATARRGDSLEVDGTTYEVGKAMLDQATGTIWLLDLIPQD